MGNLVFHALPPDDVLATMGGIALRHGQMENQIRLLIGDLVDMPKDEALHATRRTPSWELRKRAVKLAKQRLGEGKPLLQLQSLLARAERVTDKRNTLVHSVWGRELDGPTVIRDEDHLFQPAPPLEEMQQILGDVEHVLEDLLNARKSGFLWEALSRPKLGHH